MATVKVRIAVAVDAAGHWNACGFSGARSDAEKMDLCVETLDSGERRYWLDAELEIPITQSVEAKVTEEVERPK